jgi:hypothetical protein
LQNPRVGDLVVSYQEVRTGLSTVVNDMAGIGTSGGSARMYPILL